MQEALHAVTPDKKPDGADGKKNPSDGSGLEIVKAVFTATLAALEAAQKKAAPAPLNTSFEAKATADINEKPKE